MSLSLLEAALPVVAAAASGVAVIFTALVTYRKRQAERAYLELLKASTQLATLRHQGREKEGFSEEERKALMAEFERLASKLKHTEQLLVLEGLKQESTKGRQRYADKLLYEVAGGTSFRW